MNLKKEIDKIIKALKEDRDYYIAWQSNIAMCMYDEFRRNKVKISNEQLHKICNDGAISFLNLFIKGA